MPRFGVLGSGVVAKVLAAGLKQHGHTVRIGSREPEKLASFQKETGIEAGTFGDVAGTAEVVVLAVKGTAAREALDLAGADRLAGKVVIDTTNPIADAPPVDGVLQYFTGPNESLMERLQKRRGSSRRSTPWATCRWSIRPSPPGRPRCSSVATTRTRNEWSRRCWRNLAGSRQIWAARPRRARSNRCVSCGVFPRFGRNARRTRSS